jgi:hypothetical protein
MEQITVVIGDRLGKAADAEETQDRSDRNTRRDLHVKAFV